MKEILLVSLTRFGDLIQATPLIRCLRRAHPDARISLAVLDRFSGILPLIPGCDHAVTFDKTGAAQHICQEDDPLAAYRHMDEFIAALEQTTYDLIVNLTCDRMSIFLVSTLKSSPVSRAYAADTSQLMTGGRWETFLVSTILGENRRHNRINLVDVFTKMGGCNPDGRGVELRETTAGKDFADRFIVEAGLTGERLIGIQLGASDATRCWPAENFARLSDMLQAQAGVRTVLFGSPGEQETAERAMALMQTAPVNTVGQTGIEELFSLLKRCSLLVTNDTGTMHFAAAGGVPVIMLSVGPAFFRWTGPCSPGNLALQPLLPCSPCRYNFDCSDPVCRSGIPVEAVHNACRLAMNEDVALASAFPGVRVYQSRFDQDGFLEWTGVCNDDREQEEISTRYCRLWKGFLDDVSPPDTRQQLAPASDLQMLAARGMEITARIMEAAHQSPLPIELITSLGREEAGVETELRRLGSHDPVMAPLVDYLTLVRENITSDDLYAIASETHQVYSQGQQLASLLQGC